MSSMSLVTPAPAGGLTKAEREERKALFRRAIVPDGNPAQVDVILAICEQYGLDPLLKHMVLIKDKPYVTRDGLLHAAHASGVFDGIEVTVAQLPDGEWSATCAVWRKDMARPIRYTVYEREHKPRNADARSAWGQYPRAMLGKCAEVAALRRAFDVSLGAVEELGYDGSSDRSSIGRVTVIERDAAPPAIVALPAPVEATPAAPALDFAAWSASLDQQAADGVALRAIAEEVGRVWERLTDDQAQAVTLRLEQIKATRKAGKAALDVAPDAKVAPTRPAKLTDEALLARVIDATRPEDARAGAAALFLDRAQDAEGLFARVAQLTVLDFPRAILDVLVAEQRERLGLPDDEDAGEVIEVVTVLDDEDSDLMYEAAE